MQMETFYFYKVTQFCGSVAHKIMNQLGILFKHISTKKCIKSIVICFKSTCYHFVYHTESIRCSHIPKNFDQMMKFCTLNLFLMSKFQY